MTKVQKSDPGLPSRSDSFLKMLDLEKRYKMQRIQGHTPATIISPSTSSPSAQPDKPFKARRVSGHPPLSHQIQIMKAVRRSSALPSLSISIPPSAEDPAVATNGPPGDLQPRKEERTKTVTFSGPEVEDDGDSSGQSSICQSPSWEQYGRKKKKKPKKQDADADADAGKKGEEKSANTLRKKGNKLSKVPPPNFQGVESLITTDRSQSAPELDRFLKSNAAKLDTPIPTPPDEMTNQKLDSKPKSKGFLSGFRLQHGNVAAVQKILDGQRTSSDENHSGGSPMLKPQNSAPVDSNLINLRKPPSIMSAVSNSTRSISSLDQLPSNARNSAGSSHGRSQSLLSSTLNKLKGPSYLYYRPPEISKGIKFQRPSSSHEADITTGLPDNQPSKRPVVQQPERPRERSSKSVDSTQKLPEFSFPPKPKHVVTQPTVEVVARSPRPQARIEDPGDTGNGYEAPEPNSYRGRRIQMPQDRVPTREVAMERDRRSRPERAPRAPRQPAEYVENDKDIPQQAEQLRRRLESKYHTNQQMNGYVQPRVESWVESEHTPGPRPSSQQEPTYIKNEKLNHAEPDLSRDEEDDGGSIGTHASTIRPVSRRQGRNSPPTDGRTHVTFPSSPNMIGRAVTSDSTDEEVRIPVTQPPKSNQSTEGEEVIPAGNPQRPDRSADYFSFVNQSYAPPSLELRSPNDGKFTSPRIDEEPEEDDNLYRILRQIPAKRANEVTSPSEYPSQTAMPSSNVTNRIVRQRPTKNSPSLSSHYSDSDVPALERLGISPKAARILAGVETSSTSTSQSNTDPSRTNSERSSSSTCDDTPPSPVMLPTPDSSRARPQKEAAAPRTDVQDRTPRRTYRPPAVELPSKNTSRSTSRDAIGQDDSWSRTALPIDLENDTAAASNLNSLKSSPQLVPNPTSASFTEDIKESLDEDEFMNKNQVQHSLPPRAQSAIDVHSTNFLPDLRHRALQQKKDRGATISASLPGTPPPEIVDGGPRKSALRTSRKNSANNDEPATIVSPGAAYLQEARKAAPVPPTSTSRALRPHYTHKNSSISIKSVGTPDNRSEPLAKMLVECCSCKFFHDMPSRVYECMAKPDSIVEDKLLGVSATITTMVKCPWCGHGMSTQCCSGYAAVVYLKEKLHGK
ncbi:hypothetical protein F4813DRAFT_383767 [Daldinia decipiens]|uniref:uncharacterized protein n=1 Tax=Daldinia decipiens TaxID=326647 RepID=UPI0020C57E34|nr:uncharacterized protein F4813DRAFT_383767 [Daldinia decipiens]KAI1652722.1 hypothetical protein F4813DRAFT_383767 [Daldinia decipiens]